jgi:hypothetical protein
MPLMWLRAHAQAIEGLQAEEAFREAEIVAVGGGNLKERERDKILHLWNKMLNREGEAEYRPGMYKAFRHLLEGTGIGLRLVK